MSAKPLVALNVKIDASLLERVDAHAERLTRQGAIPGITFGRSDAVRNLLAVALEQAEKADPARVMAAEKPNEPSHTKNRKGGK